MKVAIFLTIETCGQTVLSDRSFWIGQKLMENASFESFNFGIFTHFCPIIINLSGSTIWLQALAFQKVAKLTIFNQLLSSQNVTVARFACNVEWDFFCDFQTPCNYHLIRLFTP